MTDRDRLSLCAAAATALTCSVLFSIFLGARWVPALLGVVVVVASFSALGRWLRLPAALGPVFTAAGLAMYVTAVFASSAAIGRILPGPAALRVLRTRVDGGFADIQALAPPVPSDSGVLLITVLGVAAVALAVDVLAATLRRPPLAGVPLLALFAVPAALSPQGSGVVPFALSVSGYLLLLGADNQDRVARWGRPLRTTAQLDALSRLTSASYAEEPPTAAMGRRIGLGAIGLALLVPVLIPGLHVGYLGGTGGSGVGPGGGHGSSVTTYNPIVRLRDQLTATRTTVLLRVRTAGGNPNGYLRMAALDVFDGSTWSQGSLRASRSDRVSAPSALPHPALPGPTTRASVAVSTDLVARWLPLPYQPTSISIQGDWRYENRTGTVFSTRDTTRGQTYTVSSAQLSANPTTLDKAQLAPADQPAFSAYVSYPRNLPRVIRDTVDGIVSQAKATTPYQQAVAIQDYFRSGRFTYSLRVPAGNSDDAVVNFLQARRGFCEQFAATMALFARMEGIPARVAVGFTYGERAADGEYVVTTKDAHAWPELYFPGAGWLPFEPTPVAGRAQTVPPAYTGGGGTTGAAASSDLAVRSQQRGSLQDRRFGNRDEEAGGSVPAASPKARTATFSTRWRWTVAAVGAASLLLTPALIRVAARRRRWRRVRSAAWPAMPTAAAHAAWQDLREDAHDFGLPWPASASPRGAAAWLRARVTLPLVAATALDMLVRAEERASFRPDGREGMAGATAGLPAAELRAAAATVRAALVRHAGPRRRWRARLAPSSALESLRVAAGRLAVVGDRADRALARITRTLLRRRPATR